MRQEFKDPKVEKETCDCTDGDFECDFNFVRNSDGKCERRGDLVILNGQCKAFDEDTTFLGSSGYRQIPGDDCKRTSETKQDDPIERKCSDAVGTPEHTQNPFVGNSFLERIYLERTDSSGGDDETIIARTSKNRIYLSKDHGKTWVEILQGIHVKFIVPHRYFNDVVYFITANRRIYYSVDRGNTIQEAEDKAPTYADKDYRPIMNFHPKHKDWIIWTGVKDKKCVTATVRLPSVMIVGIIGRHSGASSGNASLFLQFPGGGSMTSSSIVMLGQMSPYRMKITRGSLCQAATFLMRRTCISMIS
jgi:hypothetical protein